MPIIGGYFDSPRDPTPNPPGTPFIGYINVVTPANVFSNTANAAFPVTNLANPATHLLWKSTVTSGLESLYVSGGGSQIDYVAFCGHNFDQLNGVEVFIADTSVSPHNVLAQIDLADWDQNRPMIVHFPPGNYPSIEIDIFFSSSGGTTPQAAVLYVGAGLWLERGVKVDVMHTPIRFGRKTNVVNGMSESGNFLGRIVTGESRLSRAEFFGFTPDFYRTFMDPFLKFAQENPFFWAWAPDLYPRETGYVWLTNDPRPEVSPDHLRLALSLDMAGLA